jgi:hypothetical protein
MMAVILLEKPKARLNHVATCFEECHKKQSHTYIFKLSSRQVFYSMDIKEKFHSRFGGF